jgi:hypothetical protein
MCSYGGLLPKEDGSRSNPSIAIWLSLKVAASPKRAYDGFGLLQGWHFLRGRRL